MPKTKSLAIVMSLLAVACLSSAQGEPPVAGSGIIEGTVRYQPSESVRWRESRDYIKDAKKGFLRGAVVVLERVGQNPEATRREAKTFVMDQEGFLFVPDILAIREGDSVKFTNSDGAFHNVMTRDGSKPFNVNLATGEEYRHTFTRAAGLENPVKLSCVFHAEMKGWIYVFNHDRYRVTAEDGRFKFQNVFPGEYNLTMTHPAGGLESKRKIVATAADEKLAVDIVASPDKDAEATSNSKGR